ncbi:MAG: acyl-ACP--UDP-N-acetylglucosamine O-acyltransferase [Planctomycetes bacterium]|nr:acyl-ACP--UDP-N-acetylglucosamine O-acyltransferase [Planctomycetota bacterium]
MHPTVELGAEVRIDAYAVVGENTVLGDRCRIDSFAVVGPNTWLGNDNRVYHHAAVGSDPQDLSYGDEETYLVMGDGNRVREFVTINRGTIKGDKYTRIGSGNLFMACCHVAHDCLIGDHVVLANNVLLAGHVTVEGGAIVNGAAGVQQFSTIGRLSYVGGLTRIVHDVPPFMIVEGNPSKVRKVNTVGLTRAGYADDQISALRDAHRRLYRSRRPRSEILTALESESSVSAEVAELCQFLRRVERGQRGRSREL